MKIRGNVERYAVAELQNVVCLLAEMKVVLETLPLKREVYPCSIRLISRAEQYKDLAMIAFNRTARDYFSVALNIHHALLNLSKLRLRFEDVSDVDEMIGNLRLTMVETSYQKMDMNSQISR